MSSASKDQYFRISKVEDNYVIFPFPPIKNKKWLIIIGPDEHEAKQVLSLLNQSTLLSPLDSPESYSQLGLHKDGRTPLFKIK